jgi:ferrous iron transport protein B
VVVVDATHLERNLNLALQVLEITDRAVVCLNLVDEARRHGRTIDHRRLARDLGVPVVPTVARSRKGIDELLDTIAGVASGEIHCKPRRLERRSRASEHVVAERAGSIESAYPGLSNARWVSLRLLDGDTNLEAALRSGALVELSGNAPQARAVGDEAGPSNGVALRVLEQARSLRWELGPEFQDSLAEDLYTEAAALADRSTLVDGARPGFDLDRTIDNLVTSPWFGFPMMIAILTGVFWVTVSGANVPSSMLATLLIDKGQPLLHTLGNVLHMPLCPSPRAS